MAQAKPEAILSLCERLKAHRHQAQVRGRTALAADLRLAAHYLRILAAVLIAEQAGAETDPIRRQQLVAELLQLRQEESACVSNRHNAKRSVRTG